MVSPAVTVAATRSASDSNLRCRKGEWPACSDRRGNNLPRPILISVATKENGFACNGRGGYEVRVRFHSSLPRRRMVPPAERHYPTDASILDFEARLGNHCRFLPGNALQRAVILDFRPRIGNHCMVFPGTIPKTASILDFRPRLRNRCSTIVAAKENTPPAAQSWGAGRGRVPRRRHNPK